MINCVKEVDLNEVKKCDYEIKIDDIIYVLGFIIKIMWNIWEVFEVYFWLIDVGEFSVFYDEYFMIKY